MVPELTEKSERPKHVETAPKKRWHVELDWSMIRHEKAFGFGSCIHSRTLQKMVADSETADTKLCSK